MAVFSTNQNRQLYVVKNYLSSGEPAVAGDIKIGTTNEGEIFFKYMGEDGLVRSDFIKIDSISYGKHTEASELARNLKTAVIEIDSNVNSGNLVPGQDYIVRVYIHNYMAPGDDNVAIKYGAVHAYADMTTAKFYEALAKSLKANFSREVQPLLDFGAVLSTEGITVLLSGEGATGVSLKKASAGTLGAAYASNVLTITPSSTASNNTVKAYQEKVDTALSGTGLKAVVTSVDNTNSTADTTGVGVSGVGILEVEQPWHLGIMPQDSVNFDVVPLKITINGEEETWAVVDEKTGMVTVEANGTTIGDGKKLADLEYFCMGERGDQYRMQGWPNIIPTKYMVDPTEEYDVIDIHYSFSDTGVNVHKSEKDITFIVDPTKASAFASAIDTAVGKTLLVQP